MKKLIARVLVLLGSHCDYIGIFCRADTYSSPLDSIDPTP